MASLSTTQATSPMTSDPQAQTMASQIQAYQSFVPHVNPLSLRLDRHNFQFWSSQVLSTTRAYGLEDFLLGSNSAPSQFLSNTDSNGVVTQVPNPEYILWLRHDQFLLSWLFASISESMLGHVNRCLRSADVWSTLGQIFQTTSKARVLQLRLLLQTTKKGSQSIDEFILKMKGIADNLSYSGSAIKDDDLILYILGGLGSEYESVVVNLTSRSDDLSLSEVQFALQSQEMRLEALNSTTTESAPMANLAYRGGGRHNNGGGRRGRGRGGRSGGRNSNNNSRPVCQLCGRIGHLAIKCFHRFDLHFQGVSPQQNQGSGNSPQQQPQVFTASGQDDDASQDWYLDSGATHHVTSELSNININSDYKGKNKLVVGNGQGFEESTSGGRT